MAELEALTGGTFQTFEQKETGRRLARLVGGVRLPADIAKHVETFTGLHGFPLDAKPLARNVTDGAQVVTPAVIKKSVLSTKSSRGSSEPESHLESISWTTRCQQP